MVENPSPLKPSPDEVIARILAKRIPRPALDNAYVPAETQIQQQLSSCCAEVLGYDTVGLADNFFALGGDSLQMTRILSRIRQATGVELTFDDFFSCSTIADLAAVMESRLRGGNNDQPIPSSEAGTIQSQGEKPDSEICDH